MSYTITFDDKAKEIIKTIVTEGDMPTPTPEPTPTAMEFYPFESGLYTINPTAVLDIFKAKNIDLDTDVSEDGFDVIFGIISSEEHTDILKASIHFYLYSGYVDGTLTLGSNDNFNTDIDISSDHLTFKKAFEALAVSHDTPSVYINSSESYYPTLWISVYGESTTRYTLTKEEFDKVIYRVSQPILVAN